MIDIKTTAMTPKLIVKPAANSELLIEAACMYFEISREALFGKSKKASHARNKGIIFYMINDLCQISPDDIAEMAHTTRQNVSYRIEKAEIEIKMYLQSACSYRIIKHIYETLCEAQKIWLKTSQQNNLTP